MAGYYEDSIRNIKKMDESELILLIEQATEELRLMKLKQFEKTCYLTYYNIQGNKVNHVCKICDKIVDKIIVVRNFDGTPYKYVCSENCVIIAKEELRN